MAVLPEPPVKPAAAPASTLDAYSVQVAASESIPLRREPGLLSVWIGLAGAEPAPEAGARSAVAPLGPGGNTALVEPYAPGFRVKPDTPACQKLDPTGTQVRYELHPEARGHFKVGANVKLFASQDCSGPPVPKSSKLVEVTVVVPVWDDVVDGGLDLLALTWKKVVDFWAAAVAAALAALLLLWRKRLLRWTGTGKDTAASADRPGI